jgi:hypothetical protein
LTEAASPIDPDLVASRADGLTEEQHKSLQARALARRVALARQDPATFFELVFREETTRSKIRTLPHQHVQFDFITAHERCVLRNPVGSSKTYCMSALTAWQLGQDPTSRGVILSATERQAQKTFGFVRDYIETSPELRLVFPNLRRSAREHDLWTQTRMVVDRPPGIRDPSLTAIGENGNLPGSRLSWIFVDDLLDNDNTMTLESRERLRVYFHRMVLSRKDVVGAKIVVTNTPYDPDDLTYALEGAGWPTLTMDVEGDIFVTQTDWTSEHLRVSDRAEEAGPGAPMRLVAHDSADYLRMAYRDEEPPDPRRDVEDRVPLWPEKFNWPQIAKLKEEAGEEYDKLFRCRVRRRASNRVQRDWVERAKQAGLALGVNGWARKIPEELAGCPVFTGVDLAVSKRSSAARTCIFTFALQRDRRRRILRIQSDRWSGQEIIRRVRKEHDDFGSIIRVENNFGQDFLKQWTVEKDVGLPIKGAPTGRNKHDPKFGIESLFIELENGAWVFPWDGRVVAKELDRLIDGILSYSPETHAGDELMAMWLARDQARHSGALRSDYVFGSAAEATGGSPGQLLSLMTR